MLFYFKLKKSSTYGLRGQASRGNISLKKVHRLNLT